MTKSKQLIKLREAFIKSASYAIYDNFVKDLDIIIKAAHRDGYHKGHDDGYKQAKEYFSEPA